MGNSIGKNGPTNIRFPLKTLTPDEYQFLRENAKVIEADHSREKVLQLANGDYLKLFQVRHKISSGHLLPYCKRFIRNAQRLAALGIPTVDVKEHLSIPHLNLTAVRYSPLPGQCLRTPLSRCSDEEGATLTQQLGAFVSRLHQQGILFRSLHLGNLILTPDNQLGLIDISDLHRRPWPLFRSGRRRNFTHLKRYNSDREILQRWRDDFITGYTNQTRYTKEQALTLLNL